MSTATDPFASRNVVSDFLEGLAGHDAERIASLFAGRIDWRVAGDPRLPWVGTRTRRDEVAPYFRELWDALIPDESKVELGCIVACDDEHIILGHFSHVARATGRRFDTDVALHLSIHDGQITRLHLYEDTFAVSRAWTEDGSPAAISGGE